MLRFLAPVARHSNTSAYGMMLPAYVLGRLPWPKDETVEWSWLFRDTLRAIGRLFWPPLSREPLRLRDLCRGHSRSDEIAVIDGGFLVFNL